MRRIEEYDLVFNPEGDALPGEPKNPMLKVGDTEAVFIRSLGEEYRIENLEPHHYGKLAALKELHMLEVAEPEMGENPQNQKEYIALLKY